MKIRQVNIHLKNGNKLGIATDNLQDTLESLAAQILKNKKCIQKLSSPFLGITSRKTRHINRFTRDDAYSYIIKLYNTQNLVRLNIYCDNIFNTTIQIHLIIVDKDTPITDEITLLQASDITNDTDTINISDFIRILKMSSTSKIDYESNRIVYDEKEDGHSHAVVIDNELTCKTESIGGIIFEREFKYYMGTCITINTYK